MSHTDLIGKKVLSPKFGVGLIQSIEKIGGDREFLVVVSQELNVKNFIPVDDENEYRFLSDAEDFQKLIDDLKPHVEIKDFESKQERINYFKVESRIQDLDKISFLLCELAAIEDRGTVEDTTLKKLIETLSVEASLVLEDTSRVKATKTIKENLGL